ncbi:hypothetical protein V2G26_009352 [Clonostachys chloroleuca]
MQPGKASFKAQQNGQSSKQNSKARTTTLGQYTVRSSHLDTRINSSIGNRPGFYGHFRSCTSYHRSRGGYGSSYLEIHTRFNSDRPKSTALLRTLLFQGKNNSK